MRTDTSPVVNENSRDYHLGRRAFLAQVGLLGAAITLLPRSALALTGADPVDSVVDRLEPVLVELGRDTYNGLCAFVVPGPDAYSAAQGTPRSEPGAIDAKAPEFLIRTIDEFLPFPQALGQPVAAAVATGLTDSGLALPLDLGSVLPGEVATLDRALRHLLATNAAVPLSTSVALLLNLLATQVNPAALSGPFLAPFSRLSSREKATVFARLEGPQSDLVGLLDAQLPEPLRQSASGLLKFLAGALLAFAAFGAFSEYAVFDPTTKTLTGTPVGWQLTSFDPPPHGDGDNDFRGYWQDRREVQDA